GGLIPPRSNRSAVTTSCGTAGFATGQPPLDPLLSVADNAATLATHDSAAVRSGNSHVPPRDDRPALPRTGTDSCPTSSVAGQADSVRRHSGPAVLHRRRTSSGRAGRPPQLVPRRSVCRVHLHRAAV